MAPLDDRVSRSLTELSTFLLSEENLDTTLSRIAKLAVSAIQGCDGVGVTLSRDNVAVTSACTDSFTGEIDAIQYAEDEGPCLDAMRKGKAFLIDSVSQESRWPRFCAQAAGRGVSSSLSLPLVVRDKRLGALNLYSNSEHAFADEDRQIGSMIAAQAGVALSNAEIYERTVTLSDQLFDALESRAVIDQAKGILMAQKHCGEEEAFAMLEDASKALEKEIPEVADKVVASVAFRK
jgi:GAF domain-containing protein